MKWEKTFEEAIRARRSCRSYENRAVEAEKMRKLNAFLEERNKSVGSPNRFALLEIKDAGEKVGKYGMIAGAQNYMVGITGKGNVHMEDFGLEFEKIVLFATSLGLGTCWLAGINREIFDKKVDLADNQVVAVASPFGYAKSIGFREGLVRMVVNADKRKPWEELFFDVEPGRPLSREKAGRFALPLEMVRLAPSASNKQPWRVVLDGTKVHFCLLRNKGYGDGLPIDVQKNDIGIAMCHFEMTSGAGKWTFDEGIRYDNEWEYVKTWEAI